MTEVYYRTNATRNQKRKQDNLGNDISAKFSAVIFFSNH